MKGVKRTTLAVAAGGLIGLGSVLQAFIPAAASGSISVVDFKQCANGSPGTTTTPPNACIGWINGDLNANNSQYREDQVVPQRLELSLGKSNAVTDHTITLTYLDRKGSVEAHAYDSLATWNSTVSAADRCQGLSASECVGGAASTIAIPADPTAVPPIGSGGNGSTVTSAHQLTGQVFVMYGGTLTSVSGYTHSAAPASGSDDNTSVTVHYTAAAGATVQLLFGGHLAAESGPRGWGTGLGASSINGGPYHMSLVNADGVSIGSQDNNIQSAAILGQASLSITKTADSSTVNAGGTVGFTITVTNNGSGSASGVVVTDNLPNTGSAWSLSPAVKGCAISGAVSSQVLSCTLTIAASSAVAIHVVSVAANPASCGTLSNTATFTGGGTSGSAGPVSVTVTCPALKVTKTPDAASVSSTQNIGFTITVANTGNGAATNVTLNDPLPGGTGVSWSIDKQPSQGSCSISGSTPSQTLACSLGTIAAGGSVSLHITSATTAATSGTFTNTATAQASNSPPASGTGAETVNPPSLSVTKTPDAASVSSGSPIGFTIKVSNTGTGTAFATTLNDPLPTGTGLNWSINPAYTGPGTCSISGSAPAQQTLACAFGDLAAGASVSVHVTSPTTANTSGTFSNTATAQASNNPPTTGTGSETVNQPGLAVTKTPDAAAVSSGSPIGFTIKVSNSGVGTATSVTLNDPLPVAPGLNWSISPAYSGPGSCSISGTAPAQQTLSCSFGDMAPAASVSVHVTSPTTADTSGTITNTATAQASNNPPTSGSGSETVNQPSLSVTKTPDAPSVSSGSPIGFTITVRNLSAAGTATAVTLSDPLPAAPGLNWSISPAYSGPGSCSISGTAPAQQTLSCSFGDMAPGASVSVHVTSPTSAQTSGVIANTATAQGSNNPPTTGSGSETVNQPNLHISKTPDQSAVSAGQSIGYTITVSNSGPGTATAVSVTDTLPGNAGLRWSVSSISPAPTSPDGCAISAANPQVLTCSFASLAPNQSFAIHVTSPTSSATCGSVQNTATVSASNAVGSITTGVATVTVNCPDVHIAKTADQASISAGQQIGFTITVTNMGAGTASNVTVTDNLPSNAGLSWSVSSVNPSGAGTCSIAGTPQVLTCTIPSIAPGGKVAIDVVSPTTAATCGTVANSASETTGNDGSATTPAPATVTVNCPDVHVAKTADSGTVNEGQQIGYTITVTNMGAGTAINVVVTDTLPSAPGISWSIAAVTPALTGTDSCSISTGPPQVLTCSFASLAPNASVAIHIVSPTTAQSCGTLSNTASETTGNGGSATTPAPVIITVNCPVLGVSKTGCPATSIPSGGLLTYTIGFSNTGAAPANSTTLVDTLPSGTQVAQAGGGTASGNTVSWNLGTLAPGASGSKTLVVLVTAGNGVTLVNQVTLSSPDAATSATASTSTLVSNAGAITHGSAYGANIAALGTTVVSQLDPVATVAPGSPATAVNQAATVPVPGVLTANLVRQTSDSAVTDQAVSTSTSTVVGLNLLSGAITADAVHGVSQSTATPFTASFNSTGANFVNLVVQQSSGPVAMGNVAPNTSVTVYNPLAPTQKLASVVLYEQSGSAGLSGGMWSSSHHVNMIHALLLEPFASLPQGAEIIVAHADSDATYPSGLACGTAPSTVSGKAFTVFANGTVGTTTAANAQQGDAELPPTGGTSSDSVTGVSVPGFAGALAATDSTSGATSPTPNATASSVVHSVNVLSGLVTADLIDVASTSSATGTAASTSYGSTCGVDACSATGCTSASPCFVNLVVNGTTIVGVNGGTVAPNTSIAVPQPDGSVVLVILNEQITSGDGTRNTSGTINAIHVFVLQKSGVVSAEIIVASAHSDAHHS